MLQSQINEQPITRQQADSLIHQTKLVEEEIKAIAKQIHELEDQHHQLNLADETQAQHLHSSISNLNQSLRALKLQSSETVPSRKSSSFQLGFNIQLHFSKPDDDDLVSYFNVDSRSGDRI